MGREGYVTSLWDQLRAGGQQYQRAILATAVLAVEEPRLESAHYQSLVATALRFTET
jgi:hypothetical protein